ncbi:hypothetical protein ACVPOQ_04415 [Staphylococcus aureus]
MKWGGENYWCWYRHNYNQWCSMASCSWGGCCGGLADITNCWTITRGDIFVRGAIKEHMASLVYKLEEMGVELDYQEDGIRVRAEGELQPEQHQNSTTSWIPD